MQIKRLLWVVVLIISSLLLAVSEVYAQTLPPQEPQAAVGTAFTYQGQLKGASGPITGNCDFQFKLWDAETNGAQVGSTLTRATISVTNGAFTVTDLDFGATAFNGEARWLEIAVRCPAGSGTYTTLTTRQKLTAAPYAIQAQTAAQVPWSGVTGAPDFQQRVSGTCAVGSSIRLVNQDGSVECQAAGSSYSAGTGLNLVGTTFNVVTSTIQQRVSGTCPAGQSVQAINQNGTVVCQTASSYSAGFGLNLDGTSFNVVTGTIQQRVSGACAVGSMVREIKQDGSVECQVDATLNRNLPPAPATTASLTTVGTDVVTNSVTIGADGLGLISFYDPTNGDLKVAHCQNLGCSNTEITTVDSAGDVGKWNSIALGTDGFGLISYYDATNGDLKVVHCKNANCTSVDTPVTLDNSTNDVGAYNSIAIGADGFGLISYYDATGQDLKVIHCQDTACAGADAPTPVDSTGDVGAFSSIAIGIDGYGLISYYDKTPANLNLKVVHCTNIACSSFDAPRNADQGGDVGQYTSITIGTDGRGLISYYDATNKRPKVIHCRELNCAGFDGSVNVDTGSEVGKWTSINIGSDGMGIISYYDAANLRLKVAHCQDTRCQNNYIDLHVVDSSGDVGKNSSITIGVDGLPLIVYFDAINTSLRAAHCTNSFCANYFRRR